MLGIDTGGTFTDAVLFDNRKGVLATAKSLTVRHDLSLGIDAAVRKLPDNLRSQITLVSLSTTLATNAVVEGHGSKIAVILAGYSESELQRSQIKEFLNESPVVRIAGGHDAGGSENTILDLNAARAAVEKYHKSVSAFAVSAHFSVRNPAHELQLASLIDSISGIPVTCGHQLAGMLDAPRRALTAALNARLIGYIHKLLLAVKKSLKALSIDAPIMVVKGDGSLINAETAISRPIETILSGPAASVIAACYLSGHKSAIVADMGGTTTDVAVVHEGRLETSTDGAVIGDWRPMTEAVKVYSIGLGGDSEVRFKAGSGMEIGPRRVMPVCLLTQLYPHTLKALNRQINDPPTPRQNRFALRYQEDPCLLERLDKHEVQVWRLLEKGPVEIERLALQDRELSRATARLHRLGLILYSGFTPSDAAHVLDQTHHWCNEGAVLAARLWARQMRHLYGFGQWKKDDAIGPCRAVMELISSNISEVIIMAGLNQLGITENAQIRRYADMLRALLLDGPHTGDTSVFQLKFANSLPLIGVGAPAHCYFPRAAEKLKLELAIPEHAEVANAIGAIAGRVLQNARVVITQPEQGIFRVHADQGPENFNRLQDAYGAAERLASEKAIKLALKAGAKNPTIRIKREENAVNHDIDGYVFFESTVIASATGQPQI